MFTLDTPDWETYAKLPEWLRTMVANSAEAQSGKVPIPGGAAGDDQRGDSRQPVLDDIPF